MYILYKRILSNMASNTVAALLRDASTVTGSRVVPPDCADLLSFYRETVPATSAHSPVCSPPLRHPFLQRHYRYHCHLRPLCFCLCWRCRPGL